MKNQCWTLSIIVMALLPCALYIYWQIHYMDSNATVMYSFDMPYCFGDGCAFIALFFIVVFVIFLLKASYSVWLIVMKVACCATIWWSILYGIVDESKHDSRSDSAKSVQSAITV